MNMTTIDWDARCEYNPITKHKFHIAARARLRKLATILNFSDTSYDIRSNPGGIAVSGEITLHHDHIYIQVVQTMTNNHSILIRTCKGRKDYTGGANTFAPLQLLNDLPVLAERVRTMLPKR